MEEVLLVPIGKHLTIHLKEVESLAFLKFHSQYNLLYILLGKQERIALCCSAKIGSG